MSEPTPVTPKEAILAAVAEGERLRGEATKGPGDRRNADLELLDLAIRSNPWGALRVLCEALDNVSFIKRGQRWAYLKLVEAS